MRVCKSKNVVKRTLALLLVSLFLLPLSSATKTKAATISKGQAIVNEAKKYLGSPYVWGGKGEYLTTGSLNSLKSRYPNEAADGWYTTAEKYVNQGYRAFDCSGLTAYVYKQVLGINIGASTSVQVNSGYEVSKSQLQPGDLVFPHSGHVQIYIGNGQVIESPKPHYSVRINALGDVWHARRIVSGDISTPDNKDGWVYENGKSYYYENGIKKIGGWIYVNGHSYLLDSNDGHCLYGWQQVNGNWYYLNETYGHCELGWVYVNGQKYYTEPTYGHMLTGWQKVDGKWYYFNKIYGHAETNTIVDGYTLNSDGVAIDKNN